MRIPLTQTNNSDSYAIHMGPSFYPTTEYPVRWVIRDMQSPGADAEYSYAVTDTRNKFYENGRIYNADGSVTDDDFISRLLTFHNFLHAPLDKLLEHPEASSYDNYLYGLRPGNYDNLKRIVAIRDRLKVPDWAALLIAAKIINEESLCSLLIEVPDLLDSYPMEWVTHVLGIKPDHINRFGFFDDMGFHFVFKMPGSSDLEYDKNAFDRFCKIIELEKQQVFSTLQIGLV